MLFVKVTYGKSNLDCVELSAVFREAGRISQVHEELSTTNESHDKEDLGLGLEDIVHADKERMVGLHKDLFLELGAFYLIIVENHVFSQTLHRVNLLAVLLFNEEDLTKASSSNDLPDHEVLKRHLMIAFLSV